MIDTLIEIGTSNAIISLLIAMVAIIVGKWSNKPRLAYLLWLLVLVKLLMPSFLNIPTLPDSFSLFQNQPMNLELVASNAETQQIATTQTVENGSFSLITYAQNYLPLIWGIGILFAFIWSIVRIYKFNRLLKINSEIAPDSVYEFAEEVSDKLNLKKIPQIKIAYAEISPMVWWVGGKVQIFIPSVLLEKLETENLRLVLAHELAHVQRRDYLVRWVEWFATVLFWWNPIVWLAKHKLRAYEEICCDALILSSLNPKPHQYATSLLNAVESFAKSALRPPSMASKINSGGNFIRRINMILSNTHSRKPSRALQFAFFFVAALILPLGFVNAQEKNDYKNELNRMQTEIKLALENGEITPKQAKERMAEFKLRIIERQMEEAVAAGKITPEEAQKKMAAYRNGTKNKEISEVERKIKAAVEAGKLTPEEGQEKLMDYKLKKAKYKIKRAIADGKLTPEEGREKMTAYKLKVATYKLKNAVKAGKMTEDEAKAELAALKKEMINKQKEN